MKKNNNTLPVQDFYKKSFVSSDGDDITKDQNKENLETYELSAKEYSKIEWAMYSCIKSGFDTRMPFIKFLISKKLDKSPIFIPGCGSGRDTFYLAKNLFKINKYKNEIYAIDYSHEMIKLAKEKVNLKLKNHKILSNITFKDLDLRVIKNKFFIKNKFGSIFCESLLSHISEKEIDEVLETFNYIMMPNAIAFIGFRLRKDGESKVYSTQGDFGKRHYLRFYLKDLKKILYKNNFEIIWGPKISSHPDDKRPPFVNVIVQKMPL